MSNVRKIWLVEFPTYQYNEDVKVLALKAGLKIIDSRHEKSIGKEFVESDTPKLTKKTSKSKSKSKSKAKKDNKPKGSQDNNDNPDGDSGGNSE